ncbi:MBOAT, membrane-bound O-acyltransferase family-domain-containing protein [Pisolithus orientalis]|uniref:MBOAT, membrane-bound O-acyltransferase family-domain-containing protein n=1 Tax=Pisolithus orientalis TaxID=936130 RepID=UPI0022257291|nr:MBOAT, membrane-bound O-acyltransferase family-domain-containing protein [Pisolithus orientalis]KAI6035589.1 MBOAT, membrane-bound O-acyltransferase family-domain-containing protein [Pisolithus orientalis]
MDALLVPLAAALGASVDQIKLVFCLLVAYPLGSVFIRIPASQPSLKHLFNVLVSAFFFIPVLNLPSGLAQLLASILGTYFIAANVKGPMMPWIVFAFVMGHLTINHLIRAFYELSYETFEITGPQMVLTMKLTTFAWNVWDGRRPAEDLDKWQLQKRVTKYPSLLEFLGFSLYFPGILVGPYIDYASYSSLIDGSLFKAHPEPKKASRRIIPNGRKRVAYRKMVVGLLFLGAFVVLGPKFHFGIALTPWFLNQGLLKRIVIFQFCGFIERCKFYAVWTLTEGASILTGHGFTGYGPSGESLWEGAANVKIQTIELPPNFKVLLDSWNINTNVWLRECIYKRVTPKGKKPGFRSSMLTFLTSAFWHGIAPGYYLTFLFGGFITAAARRCRSGFRPLVLPSLGAPTTTAKRVYDLIGSIASILLLNYAATPFMLLTLTYSLEAWRRLHWYGFWMVGSALAFFYSGGSKYLQRLQKQQAKANPAVVAEANKTMPQTPGPMVVPPLEGAVDVALVKS